MTQTQQPEALNLEEFRAKVTRAAREPLLARIAELEEQLSVIGAGGVEPLRKRAAAQQAVQAEVPEAIEQMAVDRYKVVPSHESMFHRWAVVAGNGTQQLYIGREGECQSMARKFMGAFLDGAFVAMQNAAPAHPAEGVPQAITDEREAFVNWLHGTYPNSYSIIQAADLWFHKHVAALAWKARAALAATQPAAQGLELSNCKGDKWLTVVYRDIQPGDESRAIGEHPKVSALSWSHALHDRDAALAAQAKQGDAA